MTEWRDIETAPKDELILLYDNGAMRLAFWEGGKWTQPAVPVLQNQFGDYLGAGDIGRPELKLVLSDCLYAPSHWMPLPEAPTQ
jgi:hypothetical protein